MKLFQASSKNDDLSCLDDPSTMNTINKWFLLPIYHLALISFCTKGLPGVAESTVSKSEGKPSPWGEGARKGGWGILKRGSSPNLNQRLRRTPLSRRTRVIPGIMDSATSPSAPRRMTRWEANYEDWRFSDLKNQSKGRGNLVLCL